MKEIYKNQNQSGNFNYAAVTLDLKLMHNKFYVRFRLPSINYPYNQHDLDIIKFNCFCKNKTISEVIIVYKYM